MPKGKGKKRCSEPTVGPSFMLVRWLKDEQVGVMPTNATHSEDEIKVKNDVRVKWGKSYYEAQILCLSGKSIFMPVLVIFCASL